ncbi:hypothetical protein [Candidatus Nitrosocosmicus arcticus]|uniref:Uncharacterized protein n=1 Tax=Candidatus Nitrosocosmicus arcticus TaxID=2035267 RepID=A0A557SUE4_9ARCH|nr:hypothetical protein [Candidatus Nitrosocosmicus arcticus]TVP40223.1 exported protein of unknown function [Candidatus Nitrosocosmicus arcticus]
MLMSIIVYTLPLMVFSIICALMLSPSLSAVQLSAISPYDSGYNHGCDDAEISSPSDRHINQDERGPSLHTADFMTGYNSGVTACSSSGNDYSPQQGNNGQSSSRSNQSNSEECVKNANEFGEFASNFYPGAKIVTKLGSKYSVNKTEMTWEIRLN